MFCMRSARVRRLRVDKGPGITRPGPLDLVVVRGQGCATLVVNARDSRVLAFHAGTATGWRRRNIVRVTIVGSADIGVRIAVTGVIGGHRPKAPLQRCGCCAAGHRPDSQVHPRNRRCAQTYPQRTGRQRHRRRYARDPLSYRVFHTRSPHDPAPGHGDRGSPDNDGSCRATSGNDTQIIPSTRCVIAIIAPMHSMLRRCCPCAMVAL